MLVRTQNLDLTIKSLAKQELMPSQVKLNAQFAHQESIALTQIKQSRLTVLWERSLLEVLPLAKTAHVTTNAETQLCLHALFIIIR
jgi:hypothetical protein